MEHATPCMVGACEAFKAFERALDQVAASDATVLVRGESGSGKDLAAAEVHRRGSRAAGPFVVASLAALAPSLVEAELFGHEEGAFTGATRARLGRFRQADGGTLVLDDVASLTPAVQAKLLRALQERCVEPLGAEVPVPVDARVVATTSVDLLAWVEEGRFRRDLYYRLAVVPLEVPPLRARLEDLPLLVEHLTARLGERLGVAPRPLSPRALERLAQHAWPGNVRELENALERVLVLVPDGAADAREPRPVAPGEFDFLDRVPEGVAEDLSRAALSHGLTLADLERALLRIAMDECRGNVSAAARRVGLTRRALEYRLERGRAGRGEDAARPGADVSGSPGGKGEGA